jgi:DNA-binding response OmpR family regulator
MTQPRILVVDDNVSVVNAIQGVLTRHGFEVQRAFDGEEGLRAARAMQPDLIILDVIMPKIDGYEVCQRLQADSDTASIPILMLTVKGQVDVPAGNRAIFNTRLQERLAGFEMGALEFMSKPVRALELVARVKGLLWLAQAKPHSARNR